MQPDIAEARTDSSLTLRLGTRGSLLARAQSEAIAEQIRRLRPNLNVDLVVIKTTGDQITNQPLHNSGGKGLFVKELEQAILDRRIDFAVHSLKDVPVTMPLVDQSDLVIAANPAREDPRDVLVSKIARKLEELPKGGRVGTGSLRRMAQLLYHRPDLQVVGLRGNVDTRIRKCLDGEYDAIVLAMAGTLRSGLYDPDVMTAIPTSQMIPAAGQGALALQCRTDDQATRDILQLLNDPTTQLCVGVERSVVAALEGDCVSPIGALAEVKDGEFHLSAFAAALGGKLPVIFAKAQSPIDAASDALKAVLKSLEQQGVRQLLHPAFQDG